LGRLELEQVFEDEQVVLARRRGILRAEERVNGTLSLYMHKVRPLWQKLLFFPIQFLFSRRRYLLAVTDMRVVLCRVTTDTFGKSPRGSTNAKLPCVLKLSKSDQPTRQHLDYKIDLPLQLADFAGGTFLYASSDVKAESIVKLASSNCS
jgi:hypothetical protein